ncbi:MAG: ROK family protein [Thermomicrobiales bacterium]
MDTYRPREHWVIGVDVGGTKIALGAVDPRSGTVAHRRVIPTRPERGAKAVIADVQMEAIAVARKLLREDRWPSLLGVGLPELIDQEGRIRSSHLLEWSATDPAQQLRAVAPPFFESDVRAAALAESHFGAGRSFRLFIYVSIGTGISSAVVLDGTPLAGAHGGALVLSSGPVSVPCEACGGWSAFVLEDYASGPALARRYATATGRAVANAEAVITAAEGGDAIALDIVDSAAKALGSAIGWLVNVVDPEAVVIGGGLGLASGRFQERLHAALRDHVWNPAARDLPLIPAALGANAGIIGAALSAHHQASQHDLTVGSPLAVLNGERR